jgi:hypothetical protein
LTPVLANRSNPSKALHVAQSTGLIYDEPVAPFLNEFVSLGFNQSPVGGQLVVAFNSPVYNGLGDDLKVYEITGGENYPDEKVSVAVSNDNSNWTDVGVVVRDGSVDLGSVSSANYVKLSGVSVRADFASDADNYDVDAVQRLHNHPFVCSIPNDKC